MGANNTRLSPRQKMINLMYIVLTAMLALNVSSDVLDGFTQVQDGLSRSNLTVEQRNAAMLTQLRDFADQNPEKGTPWLNKALEVRDSTAALYTLIDSMKTLIVREADGAEGTVANLQNREDLEASSVVMLGPGSRQRGQNLRLAVDRYRQFILSLIPDKAKRTNITAMLNTAPALRPGQVTPQRWEETKFESQPTISAITMLSKLQNDILYAEGEALGYLTAQVDAGDVRVNELNAFVMPQSRMVMRGGRYHADIYLAAVDTTARPDVYIGGRKLASNVYETPAGAAGNFNYSGYLEVPHGDGTVTRHPFKGDYTVIEPMATVSPTMMNVLYAGIANPISIGVPGVDPAGVTATISNGTLTRNGRDWTARVTGVGKEAVITVTANIDGRQTQVAQTPFRIRRLPDPTAFIAYKDAQGNVEHYKGGRPLSKQILMSAQGLQAAIDDGLLDTPFKVVSFETVSFDSMGNAMPELSDGANFSARQKQAFRSLSRGKRFYISRIKATGPDGTTRNLSPIEVIIG